MQEEWIPWTPLQKMGKKYFFESLSDAEEILKICLRNDLDEEEKITFSFLSGVFAYRSTYESLRMNIIEKLTEKYPDTSHMNLNFFEVYNSSYIKYLFKDEYTGTFLSKLHHFVILEENSITDIVTLQNPIVELTKEKIK